jgi:outer membrane immunogenic protein
MFRFLALAVVAGLMVTPSLAADAVRPAPVLKPLPVVVVKGNPFDGFYIGGNAGYGWGDRHGCFGSFPAPHSCGSPPDFKYNQKGWLLGGQLGVNKVLGASGFLVGLDVAVDMTGISGNLNLPGSFFDGVGEYKALGAATAKIGWSGSNWMIYAKGGIGIGSFEYASAGCSFHSQNQGWLFGAGAEMAMASNNTLFVEWNRFAFDGKDAVCSPTGVGVYTKPSIDVIKVGFNHYFH